MPALCDEIDEKDHDWLMRLSMEEREVAEIEERFAQLSSNILELRNRKAVARFEHAHEKRQRRARTSTSSTKIY